MKKPLTDKRNFIGCNPVLLGNEIMSLIATVDEFKEENAKLKEQLDLNTPREAMIQLQEENDELKFTINFAQSANWEFKEENEKLKAENDNLAYTIRHLRSSP